MPIVTVDSVHKRYRLGDQIVAALRGASLMVEEGEFLVLSGPSGSGKSTLLNIIGCIDTADSGEVIIEGEQVVGRSPSELADLRVRTIGFVFQTFNLLPVLSAAENVEYPLLLMPELSADERQKRVKHYLDVVGLSDYAGHRPGQLSGGQRQRVAIARALAPQGRVILADEPTANLDRATGEEILDLMQALNRDSGVSFVFSTHDPKVMERADRLLHIEDGVVQDAPAD